MKEFWEKFGLAETLGHLFPGFVALCALLIWWVPQPDQFLGQELGKNQVVLGALLLVIAYALGLLLAMVSLKGDHRAQNPPQYGANLREQLKYAVSWLWWRAARLIVRMPRSKTVEEKQAEVYTLLESTHDQGTLALMVLVDAQASAFRAFASDRLGTKIATFIQEAELERRRYMFALGFALAVVVVAASALLRGLAAALANTPQAVLLPSAAWRFPVAKAVLFVLGWFAVAAAFSLRRASKTLAVVLALAAGSAVVIASGRLAVNPICALLLLSGVSLLVCLRLRDNEPNVTAVTWLFAGSAAAAVTGTLLVSTYGWIYDLASWHRQHPFPGWRLLAIPIAGFCASRALRSVAAQCWERELAHTLAIARFYGHHF